jgi:Tfp pilus assembly protein FimT
MTKGVSLVELMVILGIMAIVSGAAFLSIPGLISRNALNFATENLIAYLRDTRQKSVSQEQGNKWGVHFEGVAGDADWYEIFYGADYVSGTKTARVTLSPNLKFLEPAEGFSKDIIFSKITGAAASTSIRISLADNESVFNTINISSVGMISYVR